MMKRERIMVFGFDISMIWLWYDLGLGLGLGLEILGCGKRGNHTFSGMFYYRGSGVWVGYTKD